MDTTLTAPSWASRFYDTPEWRRFTATIRDRDGRCLVALFLGGQCSGPLHVNHILPLREFPHLALDPDNVGCACERHHPEWEAVARALRERRYRKLPRCPHHHPTREGRIQCERRRARARGLDPSLVAV